jgi:hypothetical protein
MADVEAAYQFLTANTLTAAAWWSPQFGVKTGGTTLLSSQSITCNISLADGNAFISNPSVDLTSYVGTGIKITDSAGKSVYGWIKAAGTGETYGDELVSNGGFDSDITGWSWTNCTIASVAGGQSGNCLEITRTGGDSQVSYRQITIGTDVLLSVSTYSKSGSSGNETSKVRILKADTLTLVKETSQASSASWEAFDPFYVALSEANPYVFLAKDSSTEGTMLFDTVSAKQVLTPSSTGVKIVSTSGGSTYNWASEDSGFNRNDTSYTISPLVTKLYDLSDNDYDASQATITTMPEWRANQKNGRATLYFDGVDDELSHAASLVGDSTLVAVAYGVSGGQTNARAIVGASNASEVLQAIWSRRDSDAWGTYLGADKLSSYTVYGTWRLMMDLNDGVNSNPSIDHLYTNNETVEDVSGTSRYSDANDRRKIGAASAADSAWFNGQIADVVLFASQIGATPITNMKTLQNTKWSIY